MNRLLTSKRAQKAVAFALAGSLAASPLIAPMAAYAQPSGSLEQQLNAAVADLNDLANALAQTEAELGKTNYELDQTKAQIADLENQISENEVKLVDAKGRLAMVIQESYKEGGEAGLIDLILSSESIENLVSRIYYANKVAEKKHNAINEVNDIQTNLKNDKVILEDQQREQEELLASQQEQAAAMQQAAQKQASYVSSLSNEVMQAMAAQRAVTTESSMQAAQNVIASEGEQVQVTINDDGTAVTSTGEVLDLGDAAADVTPGTTVSVPAAVTSSGGGSTSAALAAVNAALAQVGKSYGHDNNGTNWDCNGLTNYAWAQAGVEIPYASGHYSYGQYQYMQGSSGWTSSASDLNAGDLVFYSQDGGDTIYHVAMYIGDGQIVHSVDYSQGVQVTDLNYVKGFVGGGTPS